MLGHNQKEILSRYADIGEAHTIFVYIHPYRYIPRGRSGYPVSVRIVYELDKIVDLPRVVSVCRERYTAEDKGKEIARYLRDELKIENVRLRWK